MRSFIVLIVVAVTSADPVAETSIGTISGFALDFKSGDFEVFAGIPYAKPPVGDLRFELPVAFGDIGNLSATDEKPCCMQETHPLTGMEAKEDCLHLNVLRRNGTQSDARKAVSSL